MIVRPPQETLGTALAVQGKPVAPGRPMQHKNGSPPTQQYREGHPTLTSPAIPASLPLKATQGVNQTQLSGYLKAVQRGR